MLESIKTYSFVRRESSVSFWSYFCLKQSAQVSALDWESKLNDEPGNSL